MRLIKVSFITALLLYAFSAGAQSFTPDDENCMMCHKYPGLSMVSEEAAQILEGMKKNYYDADRLNYSLKQIYESMGDKKKAEKIKIPDNYNNSD